MRTGRPPKKLLEIETWLQAYLSDGPRSSDEICAAGEKRGFAWRTLMRAKAFLGIKSKRLKRDKDKLHTSYWCDPNIPISEPETELTAQQMLDKVDRKLEEHIARVVAVTAAGTASPAIDDADVCMTPAWSEEDFEQSTLEEIVAYGNEFAEDLREAEKYHGTKQSYQEGLGGKTKSYKVDNALKIRHSKAQIKRATEWIAKKSSSQPAENSTEQPVTSV